MKQSYWIDFITQNLNNPIEKVIFSISKQKDVNGTLVANQLNGTRMAESKIPTYFNHKNILYPAKVNMEQCSSELTANYKASLVRGKSFIDLTGGFGIDTYFISNSFENGIHCEVNSELQYIAQNNFKELTQKIRSVNTDGIEFIRESNDFYDLIFIDPSRRDSTNQKVIQLKDYTPNILENLDLLLSKAKSILIKTSPLLDIKQVLKQIEFINEVHVISINNECKELLFLIQKNSEKNIKICCSDLTKDVKFLFDLNDERIACKLSYPQKYIYEPNVSILKAGAFNSIANRFGLKKIHANSHIYTSDVFLENFPGRKFELTDITKLDKKEILSHLDNNKANITKRNFPLTVKEIRKKIGVKEGGKDYIFATTLMNNEKRILICKKI